MAVRELDFSEIMIFNLLINKHVDFAKTAILLFSDSHLVVLVYKNFIIDMFFPQFGHPGYHGVFMECAVAAL